jgi:hypothetical protein
MSLFFIFIIIRNEKIKNKCNMLSHIKIIAYGSGSDNMTVSIGGKEYKNTN